MHSGADVEAFQAALNRDIGGDASTSQPSDSDNGASLFFFLFFFPLFSGSLIIVYERRYGITQVLFVSLDKHVFWEVSYKQT
jgi:hypothetical protein